MQIINQNGWWAGIALQWNFSYENRNSMFGSLVCAFKFMNRGRVCALSQRLNIYNEIWKSDLMEINFDWITDDFISFKLNWL